jgi:hypothetical protein
MVAYEGGSDIRGESNASALSPRGEKDCTMGKLDIDDRADGTQATDGHDDCDNSYMEHDERFVRISEDVIVGVLTGNQYMPMR